VVGPAQNPVPIIELYRRCLTHEQNSAKINIGKLKVKLAKVLFFGRPLFEPPPLVDESSPDKQRDLKIRRQLWHASKYRGMLELFRKATNRDSRFFCLLGG
jgi:hypothetical protein